MEIIENIEKIMKNKKITAYQLERDIGIKQSTFSNWKSGKQPSIEKIQKIIPYLGVTPNELFGYENEINLTQNEKEMLDQFKKLPEREQIKFIARVEDAAKAYSIQTKEVI